VAESHEDGLDCTFEEEYEGGEIVERGEVVVYLGVIVGLHDLRQSLYYYAEQDQLVEFSMFTQFQAPKVIINHIYHIIWFYMYFIWRRREIILLKFFNLIYF